MIVAFHINAGEEILLSPIKKSDEGNKAIYELVDEHNKVWMGLSLLNNKFIIQQQDSSITDSEEAISQKLDELVLAVIEQEQSGTENTESEETIISPYDPDSIKVSTKAFSIKLISDMIDSEDIDLNPNYQRSLAWNSIQKSRLIESILLRIPLPMFYFMEDKEGLISVIDGSQRLITIKEFMDNKFPLKGLEYLQESCENKYYSDRNKDGSVNGLEGIDTKYFRWFNMTQLTVNVIDVPSADMKYEIFRRIHSGGKSLNNQEIRNTLSSKNLRETLQEMTNLEIFKKATDYSIKSPRMEDQEMALRFMCFHRYYHEDETLANYNGNMETSLDDLTKLLNTFRKEELKNYVDLFSRAMQNAEYLFGGKYAFRKIKPYHLEPNQHKQLINKALFVSLSVLLSRYEPSAIKANNPQGALALPLAEIIDDEQNTELHNYLSYRTNGKANLQFVFQTMNQLLSQHLK